MKSNLAIVESDSVVVSMTRASLALAEAVTVGQTKKIADVAHAAEIYAKRQGLSEEAIGQAMAVKVEALRKLGEILKATPKSTGAKGIGKSAVPKENRTLEDLGIDKKTSAVAQKLAGLSQEAFEQVREGHQTISKAIAVVDAKPKEGKIPLPEAKPEVTKPTLTVVETPKPEDEYTELDAAHDQIKDLQAELALANMGNASPEDRDQAKNLIAALRKEIKTLEATLKAVKTSRDTFQTENAALKAQITRQRREMDKITGKKTA